MKNFIRSLGKWTCIAINILFWGHILKVGFISLIFLRDSDINLPYNLFWALVSSIAILGIGAAIHKLAPHAYLEYLFFFVLVVQPLILITPNRYSGFPSPIFDEFALVDMKTHDYIEQGFIKKDCYTKQKLKKALISQTNKYCDNCLDGHEVKLIIIKDASYSYRFAEFSGYSESFHRCFDGSLSESSLIEKILFPLRIACEQSFFYFLRVFFTLCVLMSILDVKGLIPVKYKINMLLIEQSNLYKITSVLIAVILTMNYMYYLELF